MEELLVIGILLAFFTAVVTKLWMDDQGNEILRFTAIALFILDIVTMLLLWSQLIEPQL